MTSPPNSSSPQNGVLPQNTFAVLVAEFEAFLRVPKVTYEEWGALDEDTKAALLVAAKRIEVERAVVLASALRSERGLLRVAAEVDGGDSLVRFGLATVLDSYVAKRMAS